MQVLVSHRRVAGTTSDNRRRMSKVGVRFPPSHVSTPVVSYLGVSGRLDRRIVSPNCHPFLLLSLGTKMVTSFGVKLCKERSVKDSYKDKCNNVGTTYIVNLTKKVEIIRY